MGEDIKILDIHEISALADYFHCIRQKYKSYSNFSWILLKKIYQKWINIINKEGYSSGGWILLRFWFSSNTYIR